MHTSLASLLIFQSVVKKVTSSCDHFLTTGTAAAKAYNFTVISMQTDAKQAIVVRQLV